MNDDALALGRLQRTEAGFEGRLQRLLAHPPAAVWAMLTEPAAMAQWLAPGTIELRAGGAVRIDFADSGTLIDSTVTEFATQRVLEYSWSSPGQPQRPLRWELQVDGEGTRLELQVRLPAGEDAAKACAGFEGHLEMLAAALEGVPIKFPFDLFLKARAGYGEQLK
ncbi:MAG: SRPBCC family protein [Thermomonas sp.]|uniref:SRPBCC family protein n=1 Tax=Thermomonas sp. TaxID=1971895 RepID=UPI002622D43F|nr:SRPBCC family protein [Thermomonas sp.]MCC7096674.1 SRPBCC family protein [Thermomonas sp.]